MFENMVNRIGRAVLIVLDAGFSTGDVFKKAFEINEYSGKKLAAVIARAKKNYVGCKPVEEKQDRGAGRKRKYGDTVSFYSFFENMSQFSVTDLNIYGKIEKVEYFCTDLLWKPCGKTIRIVMVKTGDLKMVLMCSDVLLSPESIITAYTYRFKIEVTFKELKHNIGCFCYHFWTSVMPKLSKYKTATDLSGITDELDIIRIMATVKAIETFSFLGCIALGIIIIISEKFSETVWKNFSGWLRTRTSEIPSIEVTIISIRKIYTLNKKKLSGYQTFDIISKFQNDELYEYDEYCA